MLSFQYAPNSSNWPLRFLEEHVHREKCVLDPLVRRHLVVVEAIQPLVIRFHRHHGFVGNRLALQRLALARHRVVGRHGGRIDRLIAHGRAATGTAAFIDPGELERAQQVALDLQAAVVLLDEATHFA